MSDVEKVRQIIRASLGPFFQKIRKYGIKRSIEKKFPGIDFEKFVIKRIEKSLRLIKSVSISKHLGKFNIYYKNNAVHIDCVGLISFFVSQIVISDDKIIKSIEDMFEQIQDVFIKDENYLLNKINKVLIKLTQKEFISNRDFGEKNLYDLVICILLNYYNTANVGFPEWLIYAVSNINEKDLAKDFVYFVSDVIVKSLNNLSNNVYLNYDIILDSKILRFLLNKKTNQGKISDLLKIFKLNFEKIIDNLIDKYVGEAFLKGLGDHLVSIINDLIFDTSEASNNRGENKFNFTMCMGSNIYSRRFRWFGINNVDEYLEISENIAFLNSVLVKAKCETIKVSRPTVFDFGTVAEYQVENRSRYSVTLNNLKTDKKYFIRVRRGIGNFKSDFIIREDKCCDFLVMSDSQGMTKKDYDTFGEVFDKIYEKFNSAQFVAHLGDFVDDGNNENYWDFLLNSKSWSKIPVFPIAGNHEAKFHPNLDFAGVPESITNHFNIEFPEQTIKKGIYYSFEKNNCLFVFLNNNIGDGLGDEQLRWVHSTFNISKAKWKIIFMHKSVYSNGPHSGAEDINKLRNQINEICVKYRVDLVIGGHDHVYSRSRPMSFGIPTDDIKEADGSFLNMVGTIFITLGPIGVKNYRIFVNKKANNEILLDLHTPSFSRIKVTDEEMKVEIIHFTDEKFSVIDEFKIIRNEKLAYETESIESEIKNLTIVPWISMQSRVDDLEERYRCLSEDDKLKIKSHKKLKELLKYNSSYRKIRTGNIAIVFNKDEFLSSLKNKNIRTIIIRCDIIKFENRFGFGKNLKIDRDLLIKGDAKLKFVSFVVKRGINFHIGGKIIIDNNRKKFSLYPPISSFVMHENSSLVLIDDVWVEQYSSLCNKSIIKIIGDAKIFVHSSNLREIPGNFINSKDTNCIFKVG